MQSEKRLILIATAFTLGFLTIAVPLFAASKETVLHSFNGNDGANPYAGLAFDAAGNLYGTTVGGGPPGGGVVFQLVPGAKSKWNEKVLRTFGYVAGRGGSLLSADVIFDSAGNLYSTAPDGGSYGNGTVFELTPRARGKWALKVLNNFHNTKDGDGPFAGVIFDASGNLYGTTFVGGNENCNEGFGCGTVFELMPGANGKWTKTVLHRFDGTNGYRPFAGLAFDGAGRLYGTTHNGGTKSGCDFNEGCGTVFQLTPGAGGKWTEAVVHRFGKGNDGANPYAAVIFDAAGNLYGTTYYGGYGSGTVFELTPGAENHWTEKVLYSFCSVAGCPDGANPVGGLIFDAAGNLYGTTLLGGTYASGIVFKLTPGANGKWTQNVLHSFGEGKDGVNPAGGLIFDAAGNLYGTTQVGGAYCTANGGYGCGTVFEITP